MSDAISVALRPSHNPWRLSVAPMMDRTEK